MLALLPVGRTPVTDQPAKPAVGLETVTRGALPDHVNSHPPETALVPLGQFTVCDSPSLSTVFDAEVAIWGLATPEAPVAPVSPLSPLAPGAPVSPLAPGAPGAPVSPLA